MKKVILLLSVAAMIFAAGCSDDPAYEINLNNDVKAKVDGYVYKAVGAVDSALAGVTVTISGLTATTSADGYFSIDGLAPGEYMVKYEKEGYATAFYEASIEAYDYYADAKQTFQAMGLYPEDNTLKIDFKQYDFTTGDWDPCNASLVVEIEYTDDMLLDDVADYTISGGSITIPNLPLVPLVVTIKKQLIGSDMYEAEVTVGENYIEEGNVKVEVLVTEDYNDPDVDITN